MESCKESKLWLYALEFITKKGAAIKGDVPGFEDKQGKKEGHWKSSHFIYYTMVVRAIESQKYLKVTLITGINMYLYLHFYQQKIVFL